ncbi:hypothetical protein ABH941_003742 [Streptacidiphilus sp. EB103A]
MHEHRRAVFLTAELVAGVLGGFVSGMILDRSRHGAAGPNPTQRVADLSWNQDAVRLTAAEPEGVVHGTQAGTADSRLSR